MLELNQILNDVIRKHLFLYLFFSKSEAEFQFTIQDVQALHNTFVLGYPDSQFIINYCFGSRPHLSIFEKQRSTAAIQFLRFILIHHCTALSICEGARLTSIHTIPAAPATSFGDLPPLTAAVNAGESF